MNIASVVSFAFGVGLACLQVSHARAQAPQITQTPGAISGHVTDVGMDFKSVLVTPDRVTVDIDFGLKRIHAEVDYAHESLVIHSINRSTGGPASLSVPDIVRFHRVMQELPASLATEGHHADALGSVLNYVAEAPTGQPLDIDVGAKPDGITYNAICDSIGSVLPVSYTVSHKNVPGRVLVGPMCFVAPARGRCGMAGGPDPIIGITQKFTQQCLNHDACCAATGTRIIHVGPISINICGFKGNDCVPQFRAAAPGFFFAPSCAQTKGTYSDSLGHDYTLSGGPDGGLKARAVNGSVTTGDANCPTAWKVTGARTGQSIDITAKSPKGVPASCAGSFTVSGSYSDCDIAGGKYSTSGGGSGTWSWTRTSVVH